MATAVTRRLSKPIELGYATLMGTGIVWNGEPTFEDYKAAGTLLCHVNTSRNWLLGDWLNYGEGKPEWGEKYTQIINDTGLSYSSIASLKSLSKSCKFTDRYENLDWGHHNAVYRQSALTNEDRKELLKKAEEETDALGRPMSVSKLRGMAKELAAKRRGDEPEPVHASTVIDKVQSIVDAYISRMSDMEQMTLKSYLSQLAGEL